MLAQEAEMHVLKNDEIAYRRIAIVVQQETWNNAVLGIIRFKCRVIQSKSCHVSAADLEQ